MKLDELHVFNRSKVLANKVYRLVAEWPHFEKTTLGVQLVRAVDSVPSNIAEGWGRFSTQDHVKFIRYSRGSLAEARTQIELAHNRGLIPDESAAQLLSEAEELYRLLVAYSKSLPARKA